MPEDETGKGATAGQLRRMRAELLEVAALLSRPSPLLGRGALPNPAHKGLHVAGMAGRTTRTPQAVSEPLFGADADTPEPEQS